jgi:nucleolar protein 56
MPNFIFSNVIGSFIFSESYKLVDGLLFKDVEHYINKKEYEEKLRQKHKDIAELKDSDLHNILLFFKNKKYNSKFYGKNLGITKNSVRKSVNNDILIIQTINSIDDINKNINLLAKRLREWYGLYNPEISHEIQDNENFTITILKNSKKQLLNELKIDENDSMGSELREKDVSAILLLATQINNFFKLKNHYENYLKGLEKENCPNFAMVAGPTIAAKLISHAGSLRRLVEMPASTLQIIGAEKALFRHMKNKKKNLPPKFGIIHEHQLILKSKNEVHGKIARVLADKLSIAVRVDYFKGEFIGDRLKKELMEKFKVQY